MIEIIILLICIVIATSMIALSVSLFAYMKQVKRLCQQAIDAEIGQSSILLLEALLEQSERIVATQDAIRAILQNETQKGNNLLEKSDEIIQNNNEQDLWNDRKALEKVIRDLEQGVTPSHSTLANLTELEIWRKADEAHARLEGIDDVANVT